MKGDVTDDSTRKSATVALGDPEAVAGSSFRRIVE
jgi:hypothetical protein